MDDEGRVTRDVVLPATPEEVWRAIVEPSELSGWFGGDAVIEPRPRGRVELRIAGEPVRTGTVLSVTPGVRLVLVWGSSRDGSDATRVELVVLDEGGSTRLVVVESDLVGDPGDPTALRTSPTAAATGPGGRP